MSKSKGDSKYSSYYKRDNIISMVEKAINESLPLYKQPFVNYKRRTTDTKQMPTEIISELLLSRLSGTGSDRSILGVKCITRKKSYMIKHKSRPEQGDSNRNEEWNAINMLRMGISNPEYGKIIDYQVPLKNIRANSGVGKVDLISIDMNNNKLFIHELKVKPKGSKSEESLLRAVLEIYSYYLTVDSDKLLLDFDHRDASIIPSVLIQVGCRAFNEFTDSEKNANVIRLMRRLKVVFNQYKEPIHE